MPESSICAISNYLFVSIINYSVVLDSEKRKTLARPDAGTVWKIMHATCCRKEENCRTLWKQS